MESRLLTAGMAVTNTIGRRNSACDDDHYVFTFSPNTTWAVFEVRPLTNTGLGWALHRGLPLASPLNFDYASSSLGGANESPFVLATNSEPVGLSAVDWHLSVRNTSLSNVTYEVRVTEFTSFPHAGDQRRRADRQRGRESD